MKVAFFKYSGFAALAIGFSVSLAVGQTTTVQLTNGGWAYNNDAYVDDAYTSPYQMSIGGVTVPAICDDWADEITTGESWSALSTSLSQFNGSNTVGSVYYGSGSSGQQYGDLTPTGGLTQTEEYVAAADLAVQLFVEYPTLSDTNREELSLALWDIFDPTAVNTVIANYSSDSSLSTSSYTAAGVEAYLNSAIYLATTGSTTGSGSGPISGSTFESTYGVNVTIFTPTATSNGTTPETEQQGAQNYGSGQTRPQEFIYVTSVPEPSTWAFLGFDFAGSGLVGLYFLRRKSRSRV